MSLSIDGVSQFRIPWAVPPPGLPKDLAHRSPQRRLIVAA